MKDHPRTRWHKFIENLRRDFAVLSDNDRHGIIFGAGPRNGIAREALIDDWQGLTENVPAFVIPEEIRHNLDYEVAIKSVRAMIDGGVARNLPFPRMLLELPSDCRGMGHDDILR